MFYRQGCRSLEWKPQIGSNDTKKDYYRLWKGLLNTIWVVFEKNEWFDITKVSYYIDDVLYTVEANL